MREGRKQMLPGYAIHMQAVVLREFGRLGSFSIGKFLELVGLDGNENEVHGIYFGIAKYIFRPSEII